GALEALEPVGGGARAQRHGDLRLQLVDVAAPRIGGAEAGIGEQLGPPQALAELRELAVMPRTDDDLAAVTGLEGLERSDVRVAGPEAAGQLPGHEVRGEGVLEDGKLAVEHRDIDHRALAGVAPRVQGRSDADGEKEAGRDVADGDADPGR